MLMAQEEAHVAYIDVTNSFSPKRIKEMCFARVWTFVSLCWLFKGIAPEGTVGILDRIRFYRIYDAFVLINVIEQLKATVAEMVSHIHYKTYENRSQIMVRGYVLSSLIR